MERHITNGATRGGAAHWRRLRRLARHYDRNRFLGQTRADLVGREVVGLAVAAPSCGDEPAFTRVLIHALRRRRRAVLRSGRTGRPRRGPLPDALAVAIFGELAILQRQRLARAHRAGLAHLTAQLNDRAPQSPPGALNNF